MRCSTCLLDRGLRRVPQRNEGNPMKAHDPMKVTDIDQRDARLCIGHNGCVAALAGGGLVA